MELVGKKILVTGGSGFLGSKIVKLLEQKGIKNIIIPRSASCDLRIAENCAQITKNVDIVFHVAGNVGGIGYNKEHPGSVFFDNIMMDTLMMEESRKNKVKKFIAIGTVCSYPKFATVPFVEEEIWNGYPEETNASYGLSKKMMIVQANAYQQEYNFKSIILVQTNLYGPDDNFNPNTSHVIPALIKKIHDAKIEKNEPINIGSGKEITIKELVKLIKNLMNADNLTIKWNNLKPNGQPRRCLDIEKAKKELGFIPKISIEEGLRRTIELFENTNKA